MIRIEITAAAFEAIVATMPLGSVAREANRKWREANPEKGREQSRRSLAQIKKDRDELRQERDGLRQERDAWRTVAEKLNDYALLREADGRRFAPLEQRPWWRPLAGG